MSEIAQPPHLEKCICGGEGGFNFERERENRLITYWVQCLVCGTLGSNRFPSSKEAADDWNSKPENFPNRLYGASEEE